MSSNGRARSVLTISEAATYMGCGTRYLTEQIEAGLLVATDLAPNGERSNYRIAFADFVDYLHTVCWPRIPKSMAALRYHGDPDAEDQIPSARRLILEPTPRRNFCLGKKNP